MKKITNKTWRLWPKDGKNLVFFSVLLTALLTLPQCSSDDDKTSSGASDDSCSTTGSAISVSSRSPDGGNPFSGTSISMNGAGIIIDGTSPETVTGGTPSGTPAAFSFTISGGSSPFTQFTFQDLDVREMKTYCATTTNNLVAFTHGGLSIEVGGVLTATDTAVKTGCNIFIEEDGDKTGDIVRIELFNCLTVTQGSTTGQHNVSLKFISSIP